MKLENFNLSHVPVYIMSQEQLSMYATYMSVLGNREDLFGDSPYVDKYITNPPADYDVNPEYLNDEKFANTDYRGGKYLGFRMLGRLHPTQPKKSRQNSIMVYL